jgi:hypothetical protein
MPRLVRTLLGLAACAIFVEGTHAQQPASLTLRTGEVLRGEILDLSGSGFTLRMVDGMRQVPEDLVTIVDFSVGGPVTGPEIERLRGSRHLLALRSGALVGGRMLGMTGASPMRVIVETDSGRREYPATDVARILLASADAYQPSNQPVASPPPMTQTATSMPTAPIYPTPSGALPPASSLPLAEPLPGEPPLYDPNAPPPPASSLPMTDPAGGTTQVPGTGTTPPPTLLPCDPYAFAGIWDGGGSWGDIALRPGTGCSVTGTYSAYGGGSFGGVIEGDILKFSWRRPSNNLGGEGRLKVENGRLIGRYCNDNGCDPTNGTGMSMPWKGPAVASPGATQPSGGQGLAAGAGGRGIGVNIPLGRGATLGIGITLPGGGSSNSTGSTGSSSGNNTAGGNANSAGSSSTCNPQPFFTTWTGSSSWGDMTITSSGGCKIAGTYTYPGSSGGQISGTVIGDTLRFHWKGNTGGEGEAWVVAREGRANGRWCSGTGCDATNGGIFEMVRKQP